MAYEFDTLADLEELQIEKSPDTPNTRLQIPSEPRTEHYLRRQALVTHNFVCRISVLGCCISI